MTGPQREPRLPPGYRLDRSNPDVWTLRRPEGWVVAHFAQRLDYNVGMQGVKTYVSAEHRHAHGARQVSVIEA